jgi:hypothetical protein
VQSLDHCDFPAGNVSTRNRSSLYRIHGKKRESCKPTIEARLMKITGLPARSGVAGPPRPRLLRR